MTATAASLKKSISNKLNLAEEKTGSTMFKNLTGSLERDSPGIYNKTAPIFSVKPASNRILSVPSGSASAFVKSALTPVASAAAVSSKGGSSFFRYFMVFIILAFLILNIVLFLIKPVDSSFSQMYDPITNYITNLKGGQSKKEQEQAKQEQAKQEQAKQEQAKQVAQEQAEAKQAEKARQVEKKAQAQLEAQAQQTQAQAQQGQAQQGQAQQGQAQAAVNTIQTALDNKAITNNIDNKQRTTLGKKIVKKLPVIPEADDSGSRFQANKPTSKSGYCYIGEDRGFRGCIEVGEGDICMSGDIFPTQAICINPNLRE